MTANQIARRREYNFVRNQCRDKMIWPDILAAMRVCTNLQAEGEVGVCFYECEQCGGIHVGHLGSKERMFMYGSWADDVLALQGVAKA